MAVDFEEFGEDTVRAVLLSCYTGTATITRENFREINKIALALKIEWLGKCCLKFFRGICKVAKAEIDLQWLFLEAEYVVREANDSSLAEALSNSLSSETKSALMNKFAPLSIRNSSISSATTCLTISLTDTFVALVESLKERVTEAGNLQITATDRRILTSDNLVAYRTSDPARFEALVNLLDDSGDEKIMINLWKVYRNKNLAISKGQQYIGGDLVLHSVFLDGGKYVSDKEIHEPNEAENLIEKLLADDRVRNYNIFIDAIAFCEFFNSRKEYRAYPSGENIAYVGTQKNHWIVNHPVTPNQRITSLLRKAADKLGRPHILPRFSKNLQKFATTVSGSFAAAENIKTNALYPFEVGHDAFLKHFTKERTYNFLISTNQNNACKLGPGSCWIGTHFMPTEEVPATVTLIDDQSTAKKLQPSGHYHYNDLDRVHFYLKTKFLKDPSHDLETDSSLLIPLSWWPGNWHLFQDIFSEHYAQPRKAKGNKPIYGYDDRFVDLVMYYSTLG
eukprot:sb/3463981/